LNKHFGGFVFGFICNRVFSQLLGIKSAMASQALKILTTLQFWLNTAQLSGMV
jgi:hypothetical protein